MATKRALHIRAARFLAGALLLGALTALLLEAGARMLAGVLGISPYMHYDATIGWAAIENATKKHRDRGGQFDVTYEINAHGFRGPAYPVERTAGTYRILVLGDSTAFGWGVGWERTFAGILDHELADTEVVNLALSGFGLDQSYLRFRENGRRWRPDLVIIQSSPNDFEEIMYAFFNQKPKPQFVRTREGGLELTNVPVRADSPEAERFHAMSLPVPCREWLGWNSYAYNVLNEFWHGLRRSEPHRLPEGVPKVNDQSVWMYNAILRLLEDEIRRAGADGLLVHTIAQVSGTDRVVPGSLELLDLHPDFLAQGRGNASGFFFADGYHWNEAGHRLVADRLIAAVRRSQAESVTDLAVGGGHAAAPAGGSGDTRQPSGGGS